MRNQIIESIYEKMATDKRIFFLTADMGINLVEKIQKKFPDRFLNVGIAEQNLIGVSAGLANLGYLPFAYTISNFLVHRCLEQIRNDICLHNYPITLVGTSTGYDNAPLGPTHHMIDDWGCLKGFHGLDIYCPSTMAYSESILEKVLLAARPAYIRIPKGGYSGSQNLDDFTFIKKDGSRVLVVTYGELAQVCFDAQAKDGAFSLLICNRLHPLDMSALAPLVHSFPRIFVIEDHSSETGLYSSFAAMSYHNGISLEKLCSISPKKYRFDVKTQSKGYLLELMQCLISGLEADKELMCRGITS